MQTMFDNGGGQEVSVSAKALRLLFHGCDPDYIRDVCHGRCCENSSSPTGTFVQIIPAEERRYTEMGATILDGVLQNRPGESKCRFKGADSLCTLHTAGIKPFGCVASPFMLSKNDKLVVRNRYKLLVCYKAGNPALPAYNAFFSSLVLLFGEDEAWRIRRHMESGGGDMRAQMLASSYAALKAREKTIAVKKSHDPDLERKKSNIKRLAKQRKGTPVPPPLTMDFSS
jgi:hypothetical protein